MPLPHKDRVEDTCATCQSLTQEIERRLMRIASKQGTSAENRHQMVSLAEDLARRLGGLPLYEDLHDHGQ